MKRIIGASSRAYARDVYNLLSLNISPNVRTRVSSDLAVAFRLARRLGHVVALRD